MISKLTPYESEQGAIRLIHAAAIDDPTMVRQELARGIHPDVNEGEALRWAAYNGNMSCVTELLTAGADPTAKEGAAFRGAFFNRQVKASEVLGEAAVLKAKGTPSWMQAVSARQDQAPPQKRFPEAFMVSTEEGEILLHHFRRDGLVEQQGLGRLPSTQQIERSARLLYFPKPYSDFGQAILARAPEIRNAASDRFRSSIEEQFAKGSPTAPEHYVLARSFTESYRTMLSDPQSEKHLKDTIEVLLRSVLLGKHELVADGKAVTGPSIARYQLDWPRNLEDTFATFAGLPVEQAREVASNLRALSLNDLLVEVAAQIGISLPPANQWATQPLYMVEPPRVGQISEAMKPSSALGPNPELDAGPAFIDMATHRREVSEAVRLGVNAARIEWLLNEAVPRYSNQPGHTIQFNIKHKVEEGIAKLSDTLDRTPPEVLALREVLRELAPHLTNLIRVAEFLDPQTRNQIAAAATYSQIHAVGAERVR